jgi:hypothetical protein
MLRRLNVKRVAKLSSTTTKTASTSIARRRYSTKVQFIEKTFFMFFFMFRIDIESNTFKINIFLILLLIYTIFHVTIIVLYGFSIAKSRITPKSLDFVVWLVSDH